VVPGNYGKWFRRNLMSWWSEETEETASLLLILRIRTLMNCFQIFFLDCFSLTYSISCTFVSSLTSTKKLPVLSSWIIPQRFTLKWLGSLKIAVIVRIILIPMDSVLNYHSKRKNWTVDLLIRTTCLSLRTSFLTLSIPCFQNSLKANTNSFILASSYPI